MTAAVNQVLTRREGIQTRYHNEQRDITDTLGSAANTFYSPGWNGDLTTNWNCVVPGDDDKVTLRTIYGKYWIGHGSNVPIYLWYWWVIPRKETNVDFATTILEGFPDAYDHYGDPTLSSGFRRSFKIIKRGCRRLEVQGSTYFKFSKFWKAGRIITGDKEGTDKYTPGICRFLLLSASTIPLESVGPESRTVLGYTRLNIISREGCSFTALTGGNAPQILVTGTVPGVAPAHTFSDTTDDPVAELQ